jgi:hypothetical protein
MHIQQTTGGGDVYVKLDYDVNNGSTTENKTLSIDLPRHHLAAGPVCVVVTNSD